MKILLTTDWYAPAINGVVTSVQNLRRGLEERGHEVRVLTLSGEPHSYEKSGVVYMGSVNMKAVYPGARLKIARGKKWMRELIQWQPDIVHSNCEFSTFRCARRIAEERKIPLVHTYHTVYEQYTHYLLPSEAWGRKMARALSRYIAARTDCLIAPTGKVEHMLSGYGITTPIRVIPTGIEQEKFSRVENREKAAALRKKLYISKDETVLLFLGRLAKEKNCGELLRAVAGCGDNKVKLLLVGDGPYRESLERQARELEIGRQVIFTGMVPPEEVDIYYQAGDLFVSASYSETQGLTYLEALSAGLPMLCRRDECLKGVLLDGVNGWQYDSFPDFIQKLRLFFASPAQREALRLGAARTGRLFSVASFARSMEQVYEELILKKSFLDRGISA